MVDLLNVTYSTKSLPSSSNLWTGHVAFLADWNKIGDNRQCQTGLNMQHENYSCHGWDNKVGDQVLLQKDGILYKSEIWYESDPWTNTSAHANGMIRVQFETKSERLNIRRVTPFF
jgi:hypothetical protein